MKKFMTEFKEFINRGSVIDMAVGIIIGGAFTAIVNALIKNLITPLITAITGGADQTSGLVIHLGTSGQVMDFGSFLSAVINFLLTAFVVFCIMKAFNKSREMAEKAKRVALGLPAEEEEQKAPRLCPYCTSEIAESATRCPHCTSILPNAKANDVEHMQGKVA